MTQPTAGQLAARSLRELISLDGRTAVVTGGAAGIGRGIVRRLAEAGADVVVADLADTDAAVADAGAVGGTAVGYRLDMTDSAAVTAAVAFAVDTFGSLDIWVNNAGIYPVAAALETTDEQWDAVHNLNLRGAFIGAREAGKVMVAAGRGVIINVVSIAAFRAAGLMHYVASKHGLNGLTKSLAVELGPHGVRVLSVAPGMIQTPGMVVRTQDIHDVDVGAQVAATLPLRRVGEPDDIARAVLFCASDLSAYMTGSAIVVDGGDLA